MAVQHICLLSTLRHDTKLLDSVENRPHGSLYMLGYHYDRVLAAAEEFGASMSIASETLQKLGIEGFSNLVQEHVKANGVEDPAKVRILVDSQASINVTLSAVPPALNLFPRVLESEPQIPSTWRIVLAFGKYSGSLFTSHKTTQRDVYNTARKSMSVTSLSTEVLICNEEDSLMEGTLSTPYVWRESSWVTPHIDCGGNRGTTRRWALENGLCREAVVSRTSLVPGEIIWLSNGVRGFGWGRLEVVGDAGEGE